MDYVMKLMEKYGIPGRDAYELADSPYTFPDGAHYRMELSGIERPSTLEAMVDEMNKRKIPIHRIIATVMGATLLSMEELKDFARIAHDSRIEAIVTPGPRPFWDLGKQISTPEGAVSGLRIRGSDNLRYIISDIFRCIEAGFRGFLVWDEGLLNLLNNMKINGDIPSDTTFKVSIFAGHANAAGAKVLEMLGANTFNPVADMTLPLLGSIRKAVKLPMDLHVYLFDSMGGFNRFWEGAELARVCSPCYFKIEPGPGMGALYKPWVGPDSLAFLAREKVKQAKIIHELVQRVNPNLKLSAQGPTDLSIPKP
ncbi:MAG: hypothetical protein DDT40_01211 [candidate division WS2 bacterium]|uniref:Uncharacterized protein n=1 Tax=Psychracetigena formicireducens TaxID=2986056 RepID=A0A9E2F0G5_PSYF1|nr:hypothetical protein [Candidatus Psychracetigena formicireducens]MBT9144314.1 hypothetical protein [Candidatus Psychracetigena formicireducens]MBT9151027.1 hypothetical protein [Candidatus Psychracetigena formicireducens]